MKAPTRDVDAGTSIAAVDRVVAELEAAGLKPSPEPHEQGFTWIRGNLRAPDLVCEGVVVVV